MDICKTFKALGDPTRYKMFLLLLERHHCPRSLAQALGISEAAVSQHMALLKECGLVTAVRHCRHFHYVVDEAALEQMCGQLGAWAAQTRTACDCQGQPRCEFCAGCRCAGVMDVE